MRNLDPTEKQKTLDYVNANPNGVRIIDIARATECDPRTCWCRIQSLADRDEIRITRIYRVPIVFPKKSCSDAPCCHDCATAASCRQVCPNDPERCQFCAWLEDECPEYSRRTP